jgi:hypothetical protein
MNTLNTPDKAQPQNLVTSIDDLSGRLSVLEQHIEKLEPVLKPVLKPDQPCDESGMSAGNLLASTSDLRDTIENHKRRVNTMIAQLSNIMGRVDL